MFAVAVFGIPTSILANGFSDLLERRRAEANTITRAEANTITRAEANGGAAIEDTRCGVGGTEATALQPKPPEWRTMLHGVLHGEGQAGFFFEVPVRFESGMASEPSTIALSSNQTNLCPPPLSPLLVEVW